MQPRPLFPAKRLSDEKKEIKKEEKAEEKAVKQEIKKEEKAEKEEAKAEQKGTVASGPLDAEGIGMLLHTLLASFFVD